MSACARCAPSRSTTSSPSTASRIMCGAPIVMSILLNARDDEKRPLPHVVRFFTAAAPPPAAVLEAMREAGFEVTHLYGLTEVYGPAVVNDWKEEWNALDADAPGGSEGAPGRALSRARGARRDRPRDDAARARRRRDDGRGDVPRQCGDEGLSQEQGRRPTRPSPAAGSIPAISASSTRTAMSSCSDRSKDIIISGGENISSIEVEDALFEHPGVQLAAVVARPDDKWGETPCAFVEMKPGHSATAEELIEWCRARLARYKCPRHVVFAEIPKTSTGKVQKFALRERREARRREPDLKRCAPTPGRNIAAPRSSARSPPRRRNFPVPARRRRRASTTCARRSRKRARSRGSFFIAWASRRG